MESDEWNWSSNGTGKELRWNVFTEKLEDGVTPEGQGPIERGVRRAGCPSREKEGTMRGVIECGHHSQDHASLQPALL